GGLEDAGRRARYGFFDSLVLEHGYGWLATGHHRDDNAEQVLMNLLRGAGTRGLAGIPPVQENLCFCPIIRPLIRTAKADILSFLEGIDQAYMEDATNADPAFRRNALRHQLIPLLEEKYNPKIKQALDRLSRIMAREDEFLAREAQAGLDACLREEGPEMISLSLGNLSCYHGALIPRILRLALCRIKSDLRRIHHGHLEGIKDLMERAEPGKHLDLPGRIRIHKDRRRLTLRREQLPLRELGRREKGRKTLDKKGQTPRET
ncbi:MAG: tRNA lysidine(34) synthetase TilS, partial [Desulfobacterales bacterium]|nr:tRNA lysidine(34) synthetase TilS [Desulfobacterales bacterium]